MRLGHQGQSGREGWMPSGKRQAPGTEQTKATFSALRLFFGVLDKYKANAHYTTNSTSRQSKPDVFWRAGVMGLPIGKASGEQNLRWGRRVQKVTHCVITWKRRAVWLE